VPNSTKNWTGTHLFRHRYFGPYPKIQNSFPRLLRPGHEVSKKVRQTPSGQKLREEFDFLETGCFWPTAIPLRLADLRTSVKNYLYRVGLVLKISSWSFHFIKVIKDRQTNTCPPINIPTGKFFMPVLIPFSSLCFICSLCSWRMLNCFENVSVSSSILMSWILPTHPNIWRWCLQQSVFASALLCYSFGSIMSPTATIEH
jgi:hypothetical protein